MAAALRGFVLVHFATVTFLCIVPWTLVRLVTVTLVFLHIAALIILTTHNIFVTCTIELDVLVTYSEVRDVLLTYIHLTTSREHSTSTRPARRLVHV